MRLTPRGLSAAVFLELPLSVAQWAHLARLEPAGDAVEVKGVIADSPRNCALITRRRARLIRLALDACVGGGSRGEKETEREKR